MNLDNCRFSPSSKITYSSSDNGEVRHGSAVFLLLVSVTSRDNHSCISLSSKSSSKSFFFFAVLGAEQELGYF